MLNPQIFNQIQQKTPADRLVCIPTDEATTKLLQLEARSGSGCNRCFQPRLDSDEGIRQPPVVLDSTLPEPDKETDGKSGDNHPLVGIATMVPNDSGNARGLPQNFTNKGRSSDTPNGSGVPELVAWPISGNPLHHEEFLQRLQPPSSHHGDPKHSQTTTPCFRNGLTGDHRGIEIPLWDL